MGLPGKTKRSPSADARWTSFVAPLVIVGTEAARSSSRRQRVVPSRSVAALRRRGDADLRLPNEEAAHRSGRMTTGLSGAAAERLYQVGGQPRRRLIVYLLSVFGALEPDVTPAGAPPF
jgi:hypothetical protein